MRVRGTRDLQQAWADEVRRQVNRRGTISGEARIREPLGADVGAPTLAALAAVLERDESWDWDGERFSHPLDGGVITLDPVTRELEIMARFSTEVEVTGHAHQSISGTVAERVEADGIGVWYDDEPESGDEETARAAAAADVDRALREASAAVVARRRAEAAAQVEGSVTAAAAAAAEQALAETSAARRAELDRAAAMRLDRVGVQGRNLFHSVLALAYRDAILAYARSHGAADVGCTEADGMLEIQFEMPA